MSRRQSSAGTRTELFLERRANEGLGWLSKNLDRFAPLDVSSLEQFDPSDRIKSFSELTILYERLRSLGDPRLATRLQLPRHLRRWRRFLLERCEDRAYAELARRLPSYAFALLLPYLALRATGFRSPFHEDTLRRASAGGFLVPIEEVPHRVLDRQYFLWKSGFLSSEPDWLKLYSHTALAATRDTLHVDRDTAYAFTHTLFYLSDWGRRPLPFDTAETERVTRIVDCMMVHYWRLAHWDLLGEFLANRVAMRTRWSSLASSASTSLLKAWRADGCIAGEGSEIKGLDEAAPADRDSTIFRACYHSTLVGVLYCVCALQSRSMRA